MQLEGERVFVKVELVRVDDEVRGERVVYMQGGTLRWTVEAQVRERREMIADTVVDPRCNRRDRAVAVAGHRRRRR